MEQEPPARELTYEDMLLLQKSGGHIASEWSEETYKHFLKHPEPPYKTIGNRSIFRGDVNYPHFRFKRRPSAKRTPYLCGYATEDTAGTTGLNLCLRGPHKNSWQLWDYLTGSWLEDAWLEDGWELSTPPPIELTLRLWCNVLPGDTAAEVGKLLFREYLLLDNCQSDDSLNEAPAWQHTLKPGILSVKQMLSVIMTVHKGIGYPLEWDVLPFLDADYEQLRAETVPELHPLLEESIAYQRVQPSPQDRRQAILAAASERNQ